MSRPDRSPIGRSRRGRAGAVAAALLFGVAGAGRPADAQVRVNPTGVNVNAMGATTVFLTFGGVGATLRPAEAVWCGALVPAAPDRGNRCDPATIFGVLPARHDLSRPSGINAITDIMSIPPSVARRAYQDALRGEVSSFFYVRRFVNVAGGPDEYVAVTCRLTGGGARTPLALTDVRVEFEGGDEVLFLRAGETPPPFRARIAHNGTGRLVGRWEVVLPGEEGPAADDLLPEASLPLEARAAQRRYAQVERFNIFVPPTGEVVLPGPDPSRLPTTTEGTYRVLLRIEATNDREGDSNLGAAGAGSGIVSSAAVAGFPMPVLRYVVQGDGATVTRGGQGRLALEAPMNGGETRPDSSFRADWSGDAQAAFYRLEIARVNGGAVWTALLPAESTHYDVPPLVWRETTDGALRWRVTAMDAMGVFVRQTRWQRVVLAGGPDGRQPPQVPR
jgi:hypothetical protein